LRQQSGSMLEFELVKKDFSTDPETSYLVFLVLKELVFGKTLL